MTNTQMETTHDTLLLVSPKQVMRSCRKIPKILMMPYVKTSTKKKAPATTHPHPPSGTSAYTLGLVQPLRADVSPVMVDAEVSINVSKVKKVFKCISNVITANVPFRFGLGTDTC